MAIQSTATIADLVHRLLPPLGGPSTRLPAAMALHTLPLERLEAMLEQADFAILLDRWLTEGERQFFSGFTLPKRRLEWLGGRFAAKISLLDLLKNGNPALGADRLEILPDHAGRPHLASLDTDLPEKISVSISHSGGYAAALAVLDRPCGLDIQHLSPALEGIKERFCTAAERRLLQGCPKLAEHNKIEQLALLWSAKEAFRKVPRLSPLPGFLEMQLTAEPYSEGKAFRLTASFSRKDQHYDFSVTAWLHNDMAVAITFV